MWQHMGKMQEREREGGGGGGGGGLEGEGEGEVGREREREGGEREREGGGREMERERERDHPVVRLGEFAEVYASTLRTHALHMQLCIVQAYMKVCRSTTA